MTLEINNQKLKIIKAESFYKKITGLIGKKEINYGLLIPKCNSIHTYFMKDTIDVIGLNEKNAVIYKYLNVPKNKIISINYEQNKTSILELPKNTSIKIKIGDVLTFENEDII